MSIRVVGAQSSDWESQEPTDYEARALTLAEVEDLRQRISNLLDVSWRPFNEAGQAWGEALRWALGQVEDVVRETHDHDPMERFKRFLG